MGPNGPRRRTQGTGRLDSQGAGQTPPTFPRGDWGAVTALPRPPLKQEGGVEGPRVFSCFLILSLKSIVQRAYFGWPTLLPFTDKD